MGILEHIKVITMAINKFEVKVAADGLNFPNMWSLLEMLYFNYNHGPFLHQWALGPKINQRVMENK